MFNIALLKCQTYFSKSLVRTFVYMHVSGRTYVHTSAGENRGQNLALDALKFELKAVVSHSTSILGTELLSHERAVPTLESFHVCYFKKVVSKKLFPNDTLIPAWFCLTSPFPPSP